MNEFSIDKSIWDLGADNPAIQESIIKALSTASGYYSIPTGDIVTSIFSKDDSPLKDKMVQALDIARNMKVKDLAHIMVELRPALIIKEIEGAELAEYEKTLRDIDIASIAVFSLVKWLKSVKHEGTQNAD